LYLAYRRDPTLADEVGRFFDSVELTSKQADEQRRYHRESLRWGEERERESPPDPPLAERVLHALDNVEAGDIGAFWQRLDYFLKFDANGRSRTDPTEWDLTALPGWRAADAETRDRIVSAAKRYILEGEPGIDGWLGEDTIWETHPAYAGYRALRLLTKFAPDFVADMPDEVWERWAPVILDYPVFASTEEAGLHQELVAIAYRRAPGRVIDTVLFLVDKENEKQGFLSIVHDLKGCWDERLARAVLDKARDERLTPSCLLSVLTDLLDYGLDEAREFAESLVVSRPGVSEDERPQAVVAAQALVFHTPDAGWSVLWPAMHQDEEFSQQLGEAIANTAHHSNFPQKCLTELEAADLYIWLMDRYPPSNYFIEYRDDGHLTAIGLRESIALWRDDIPQDLRDRGTFEACRQIERIMETFPALRETMKWTLYQAKAEARLKTWVAAEPAEVRELTAERAARLVRNSDQLLDVVIESLGRLEEKLRGETPAAPDLWNERDDGSQRPKGEERFSDYVKRHLQEDLGHRGVIVNREVVIRRGEGKGRGERTDIRVDALARGPRAEEYGPVTVIIETKGNWYRRLYHEMEAQLVGRYLQENRCRHGLYLVGWFNCPQWDTDDPRNRVAMRRDPNDTLDKLRAKAADLSHGELRVETFLINAALR